MDTIKLLQQENPCVASAFDGFINALRGNVGLDDKTRQLIYIGIKSAMGDIAAIYFHVSMAKKFGATRNDISDTMAFCSLNGISPSLNRTLEAYDWSEE